MVFVFGLLIVGFIMAMQRDSALAQRVGFLAIGVCIVVSLLWMLGIHLV